jgi:hypothetical protein
MALINGVAQFWQGPFVPATGLELALGSAAISATWWLLASLLVGCVLLVFRLPSVEAEKRVAWTVFLILFSVVAIPAFWYSHIYRQPQPLFPPSDL